MNKLISCYAPFNQGGLGRYLGEIVEEARERGELIQYFGSKIKNGDDKGTTVNPSLTRLLFKIPPMRYSLGQKDYLGGLLFDKEVSTKLEIHNTAECFHGFNGKSKHTFDKARKLGFNKLILESANSHAANILSQHLKSSESKIEDTWLNSFQAKRMIAEYAMADEIYVASNYSRNSFLEAGVDEQKLHYRPLIVNSRYNNLDRVKAKDGEHFKIVSVGRIDSTKGVEVLRKAFNIFANNHTTLHFVGGTSSRGMNLYMREWLAGDSRVTLESGDPVPYLKEADVLVHPTYEDGFALAPMEALYMGVPVIVTRDTGMKDYVVDGKNGYIVETGSPEAIVEKLNQIQTTPLRGEFERPMYTSDFPKEST
jgi:glycosyltransferase involved in cell wall biosynthesis